MSDENSFSVCEEMLLHFRAVLKLLYVKFSLMSLLHERHNAHVRMTSDSISTVTYINEMDGCRSLQVMNCKRNLEVGES